MNPKSPLFLRLSDRLDVYLRLMWADKPIGTLLLLWPTYWALWLASDGIPDLAVLAAFTIGTFLMRSVAAASSTTLLTAILTVLSSVQKPSVRTGQGQENEALLLTAFLCLLAALCLIPLNHLTWLMSLPALFLALTYPFTKRFFPIPQLYLGLAFSFCIPMAFAAVAGNVPPQAWILFAANVLWTLAYDTVYAMADKEDDLKIGIKTAPPSRSGVTTSPPLCCVTESLPC